jgi:hypothetical protein
MHAASCNGGDRGECFWAISLFPCDKNIFRPHDFPLAVNHPASVKTSDQPSFSSSNFSPFTSAVPLRSSDISPVPSLDLQSNIRVGTAKKITSSPYRKSVGAAPKNEIKQATKSKPIGLRRMLFFFFQKDRREVFAGMQLRLTLHQIRTLT